MRVYAKHIVAKAKNQNPNGTPFKWEMPLASRTARVGASAGESSILAPLESGALCLHETMLFSVQAIVPRPAGSRGNSLPRWRAGCSMSTAEWKAALSATEGNGFASVSHKFKASKV